MQWVMDRWTSRRMMIPTCLQIFMMRSSIRISSFTQTFSGSECFPFLPALHFSGFTSYRNSFQTWSLASPPLFLLLCFFFNIAVSNWSSQWPPRRANKTGPQENNATCYPHMPSSSHLWPADQLTGTCWSINKHICLAAVSWSVGPTATPPQTE